MTGSNICKNTLTCNCNICNPPLQSFTKDVPAPRLVCIEPNPGPTIMLQLPKGVKRDAVGLGMDLGIQAAAELGKTIAKKNAPKKKNTKSKTTSSSSRAPTNASKNSTPLNMRVNAPVQVGKVLQTSVPNANIRVPFANQSIAVYLNGDGNLTFGISGGFSFSKNRVVLSPKGGYIQAPGSPTTEYYGPAFGASINALAALYREYRVSRLKVSFLSLLPTNQSGLYALSASADPQGVVPTGDFDAVSSFRDNVSASAWESVSMDLKGIVGKNGTQEKYYLPSSVTNATISADSNARLTAYGCLMGAHIGYSLSAGTQIGLLRLEGEVEFFDLAPFYSGNISSSALKAECKESSGSYGPNQGPPPSGPSSLPTTHPELYRQDAYTVTPSPNLSGTVTPYGVSSQR